jgi:transposase
MKAYSLDLRQKIVDTYDAGGISQRKLAERFCVSVFFVKKLFRQRTQIGSIAPKARRGWQRGRITPEIRAFVVGLYKQKNDWTLAEVAEKIDVAFGVRFSSPSVCRIVKGENLRRKKS